MAMDEFRRALEAYLQAIQDATQRRASEAQRRYLFLDFLRGGFANVQASEFELERRVLARVRGFIDVLYKDIVFEFKRDLKADAEEGRAGLTRYLTGLAGGTRYLGVLTDGVSFEVYILRGERLLLVDEANLVRLSADSPGPAFLWLDSFLFSTRSVVPTSDDVVGRFGERSPFFASAATHLAEMYARVGRDSTVAVKFEEWDKLLAKVYGSRIGSDELFIRHTYLSLLAKMLAYVSVFRRRAQDELLLGIVDGESFRARRPGLRNLAERDFFAWVLHPDVQEEASTLLRGLASHLGIYDTSRVHEDLLKELYQELVDPETRHSLGEFYTPDWLAEVTLESARFKSGQRVLDPACGSGTFLFTAIRLLKRQGLSGGALVGHCLEHIVGVDVHPLAVVIAKANYVLALAEDLKGYRQHVTIPVYMADSLLRVEDREGDAPFVVPVDEQHSFTIPRAMADDPAQLDRTIDEMTRYAGQDGSISALTEGFRKFLTRSGRDRFTHRWAANLRVMHRLVRRGRDTIWGFVLKNAYRPIYLSQRRFDLLAGNPPWLSYRNVQDPGYQQHIKELTLRVYHLLDRSEMHLFTQMDTATLFYVHCRAQYLTDRGTIAFVMPKSVLTGAKQHARFQRVGFTRVVDVEGVTPVFRVPACVLVSRTDDLHHEAIPMVQLAGELPTKNLAWGAAERYLSQVETSWTPLAVTENASDYHSDFRTGASIFPRNLWFVEFVTHDPQTPRVRTDPTVNERAKKPWQGIVMEGEVEAECLYATLLTDHLVPYGVVRLNPVVLPCPARRGTLGKLLDGPAALREGYSRLADWLEEADRHWRGRQKKGTKMTLLQRLDYQRLLSCQNPKAPYRVLYGGSGSRIAACVVETQKGKDLRVGGYPVRGFVAQHKTYVYATSTREEAHYLCAVLNSALVDAAIKPYQPKGLFGAARGRGQRGIERRPFEVVPIPRFEADNPVHQGLASLSMDCHRVVSGMRLPMDAVVGFLRRDVRKALTPQLREIEQQVAAVLSGYVPAPTAAKRTRRKGKVPLFDEDE